MSNRRHFLRALALATAGLYLRIKPDVVASLPKYEGTQPNENVHWYTMTRSEDGKWVVHGCFVFDQPEERKPLAS